MGVKMDLNNINNTKFALIIVVMALVFCLIMSMQFKSINSNMFRLLEYQAKILADDYEPDETKTTTTPSSSYQYTPNTSIYGNK